LARGTRRARGGSSAHPFAHSLAQPSELARAAWAYVSRWGLHVLPLRVGGKEPHGPSVPHGYLNASGDPGVLARWWLRAPRANVGIACAPSGLLVVDVDPRNGGDETLALAVRALGELPRTWTVLTPGGGAHYYFRCEETPDLAPLGPGIDLKHHGYVVAPPSVHPNGARYRWDLGAHPLETSLARLPPAWQARLTRASRAPVPVHASGIDARESFLGAAFERLGWLGAPLRDGRRAARCPWHGLHTDGRGRGDDSSTVLFSPAVGSTLGGFHCAHAHCAGRRVVDVLRALPPDAIDAAARAFPGAYRVVLRRLAKAQGAARAG
jgi:Bifunctional DNA primase/polymerase, N-terminal